MTGETIIDGIIKGGAVLGLIGLAIISLGLAFWVWISL